MQATRAAMKKLSPQSTNFQYFTLESSSAVATYTYCSPSPPSLSSPNESHSDQTHGSPMNSSSSTSDSFDLNLKLKELESLLLWPDCKLLIHISKDLKETLISCARSLAKDDILTTECFITEAKQMVSVFGEPFQRLAAYILEGLVARLSSSSSTIYKSLICREPASSDLLSYMHLLYEEEMIFHSDRLSVATSLYTSTAAYVTSGGCPYRKFFDKGESIKCPDDL